MSNTIELYHTSPEPIAEIRTDGLFGDALCFALQPYFMCESSTASVYKIELLEDEIVDGWYLHCHATDEECEIIRECAQQLADDAEIELDAATELLLDTATLDFAAHGDRAGEIAWEIQNLQGKMCKQMGYAAFKSNDEQGTVYIVPMSDKLHMLQDVTAEYA